MTSKKKNVFFIFVAEWSEFKNAALLKQQVSHPAARHFLSRKAPKKWEDLHI